MENQVDNHFKFGLYIKDESGELTTISERIFDAGAYKGQVDIRKILNSIQRKIQNVFSREVLDFEFGPYSLLKEYEKAAKLNKGSYDEKLFLPARKTVKIKENEFTGVELLFGLYHNESPIFTRFLYLYNYNPATRFSVDLYDTVNEIVGDIQDKILKDDKQSLWDDHFIMETKGFYHISQVRELSDTDRRRILSRV